MPQSQDPTPDAILIAAQRGDVMAMLQMALRARQAGKLLAALDWSEQAIAARPDQGAAHAVRGNILFIAGRFPEAAQAFTRAAALLPQTASLRHDLGTAWHEAGHPDQAIPAYRAALALAPDRVETWHNLGSALQASGDLNSAMAAYGAAYQRDPRGFGRIAQELAAGNPGQVWLHASALRAALAKAATSAPTLTGNASETDHDTPQV